MKVEEGRDGGDAKKEEEGKRASSFRRRKKGVRRSEALGAEARGAKSAGASVRAGREVVKRTVGRREGVQR